MGPTVRMPHVAIISFGYPPMRHVAGTRAHRMAIELEKLGHQVTVVTVDWRDGGGPLELNERGIRVIRSNPRDWNPAFAPSARPIVLERPLRLTPVRRTRTFIRIFRWGPFAPWARDGFKRLLDLHDRNPVDVVWAIHGDPSAHEIAYRFHRITGVPWIADFKDPWDLFHLGKVARPVQQAATRRRLRTCEALTETAEGQAVTDERRFDKKAHVIWSGYDDVLMASVSPRRDSERFSLAYVGHLSIQHDRDAIGRFLHELRKTPAGQQVELHLYGHRSSELMEILERHGVAQAVVQHGFLDQSAAYATMKGADALLLLPATHVAPSGASVGVKELEYFASGTPVLSLGELLPEIGRVAAGLTQTMVARTAEDAAHAILRLMENAGARRGGVNEPAVLAHAWPAKAALLSRVLCDAARRRTEVGLLSRVRRKLAHL